MSITLVNIYTKKQSKILVILAAPGPMLTLPLSLNCQQYNASSSCAVVPSPLSFFSVITVHETELKL